MRTQKHFLRTIDRPLKQQLYGDILPIARALDAQRLHFVVHDKTLVLLSVVAHMVWGDVITPVVRCTRV